MFDMVYTDKEHKDIGVIQAYGLDAAWGADENDFELVMPAPRKERKGVDKEAVITEYDGDGSIVIEQANGSTLHGLKVGGKAERVVSRNMLMPSTRASSTTSGVTFTNNNDGTWGVSGTATALVDKYLFSNSPSLPAGTYRVSNGSSNVKIYFADNTVSGSVKYYGSGGSFTLDGTGTWSLFLRVDSGVTVNETIKPQLELGTTATEYEPYHPPYVEVVQGKNGALEVVTRGKNLFDMSRIKGGYINNTGNVVVSSAYGRVEGIPCRGASKLTVQLWTNASTSRWFSPTYFDASGKYVGGYVDRYTISGEPYFMRQFDVPSDAYTMTLSLHMNGIEKLQVEYGDEPTQYEPYQSAQTDIPLQGNVLASLPDGTRDELTVDADGRVQLVKRVASEVISSGSFSKSGAYPGGFFMSNWATNRGVANNANHIQSHFTTAKTTSEYVSGTCFFDTAINFRFDADRFATVAEFSAWLANNPITVYYPLNEPQTIDLGYVEPVRTLNGYTAITLDASMDAPLTVRYVVQKATKSYEVDVVPSIDFGALVYIDGTQLGGVVDDKSPDATTDVQTVTYHGRTWHGIMADSVLSPDAGKDYITYSGDANDVIRAIIARQGLGDILICEGASGIAVSGRFDRYTDMYSGLMKMLSRDASRRGRLSIYKEPGGKVHVEAVPVSEFTSEVDSDRYGFKSTVDARPYNHLVCLGEGDLKDRDVVHLYADENGNVSTTQTLFGIDERTLTYDYSNADHDELVAKGTERLLELQQTSSVSMSVASDTGIFEVGDVVGAYDNVTGIYAESYVNKVIVNVGETGFATYSYEVGEIGTVGKSSAGGGVSMSTLYSEIGNLANKSGNNITDPLSWIKTLGVSPGDNMYLYGDGYFNLSTAWQKVNIVNYWGGNTFLGLFEFSDSSIICKHNGYIEMSCALTLADQFEYGDVIQICCAINGNYHNGNRHRVHRAEMWESSIVPTLGAWVAAGSEISIYALNEQGSRGRIFGGGSYLNVKYLRIY